MAKPSWQKDAHCTWRTASDISAVVDPTTGVAVYALCSATKGYDGPTGLGTPTGLGAL